jgi:hypothetical protein
VCGAWVCQGLPGRIQGNRVKKSSDKLMEC